jgi:hypothetical protein
MTTVDQLVEDYLDQLEQELRDVPRARRRELVGEIAQHIAEGNAESEAEVRTLLDRLGEPAEIADEARERFAVPQRPRAGGWLEIAALILLLPGSLIPIVGWLTGAVLLWMSNVWSWRDKLIGTLIVPGGLSTVLFLGLTGTEVGGGICTGDGACAPDPATSGHVLRTVAFILVLIGPFVSTAYLAWRLKQARA